MKLGSRAAVSVAEIDPGDGDLEQLTGELIPRTMVEEPVVTTDGLYCSARC